MIFWKDADFTILCENFESRDKNKFKYSNLAAAFDIETSKVNVEGNKKIAFMYIWQLAIEDIVVYGRTWNEFRECIRKVKKELKLSSKYKLIIYIHNLKYEFAFFKNELTIQTSDFLARDKNNIIKCSVENVIVFRDSYSCSEKGLSEIGKEVGIPKLELDYNKIRTQVTPLSIEELNYCANDVKILVEYIRKLKIEYGTIYNIPLTVTQAIKRIINDKCKEENGYAQSLAAKLKDCKKDNFILDKLQKAFIGGLNYFNKDYKGVEESNVTGIDITSSYPAQILLKKFPMTKFNPIEAPKDYKEILNNTYYNSKPLLITFEVSKFDAKYSYLSFLSSDRKKYIKINEKRCKFLGNKLISSQAPIKLCLNDIDFKLFLEFYNFEEEEIIIETVYASHYGYLPKYIIDTIVELYHQKNCLKKKHKKIKKYRKLTYEEKAEYDFIKSLLNRIYGVFVQDPIATNYEFDKLKGVVEEKGEEHINRKCPVLYQWGVWVTSWGRYELLNLFKKITVRLQPNGEENYIDDVLYMDTDSIKYKNKNPYATIVSQYNDKVNKDIKKFCSLNEINFDILKGIGTFDFEEYKCFKTIGLKRYCFIDENDRFEYHISGLPNDNKYFDDLKTNSEKMAAVNVNMELDEETACKHQARYYTQDVETIVEDYLGNVSKVSVKSYCIITDIGFKNKSIDFIIDTAENLDKSGLKKLLK